MKFLLLAILSSPAWAQLEKPILDGRCGKMILSIQNNVIRVEFPKKSTKRVCNFKTIDGVHGERPKSNVTLYLVPVSCDGRMNGSPGFELGNISKDSFLQVARMGKMGKGLLSVYSDKQAVHCQLKINDWDKVKKLSVVKR